MMIPTTVIDFALATTLAHYGAREDTMAVTNILYQYEADDGAQFGPDADLSEIDIRASYNAYEDAVLGALQAAYPGARVSVQSGPHRVSVNHDRDHEELPAVGEIIGEVWQSFNWVRDA